MINFEQAMKIVAANDAFNHREFIVDGVRVHDFGYNLPSYQDFHNPIPGENFNALEMRGLTFIETEEGHKRHLMLHKFFGFNSTLGVQEKDLQGQKIESVHDKVDGSIIRFMMINGRIRARSKKSFDGMHVVRALDLLEKNPNLLSFVSDTLSRNEAAIFELVSPEFKIVVPYESEELILLQIRNEETGEYFDLFSHDLVSKYNVKHAQMIPPFSSISEMKEMQASTRNIEGWIVRFGNTTVKVKTTWYDDFHDFLFEKNMSYKKIITLVVNENMDDALATLAHHERFEEISALTVRIQNYMNSLIRTLSEKAKFDGDQKDLVMAHKNDPNLGMYVQAFKNPDPDNIKNLVKSSVARHAKKEDDARKFVLSLKSDPNLEMSRALNNSDPDNYAPKFIISP